MATAPRPAPVKTGVPSLNQLKAYQVNRPGWEAVRQSLYDFTTYAAAGHSTLTFFSLPIGQGGKTLSDTNMELAGQMAANTKFLVESVEIHFLPTTPTVAAQMPGAAVAVLTIPQIVNDAYIALRGGNLQFVVGSKPYLREGPLGRFPPKTHFTVEGAAATTVAATQLTAIFPYWTGRPYMLKPAAVMLEANQNFGVTLAWPEGAQAITNPARIGVVLDGFLYRRSQ